MNFGPFIISGLVVAAIHSVEMYQTGDFFPQINGNLTEISWAHAVNNKSYLTNVLSSSVMMLEADVLYGTVNGTGPKVPIMGHPPQISSDLSLEDFLSTVDTFNNNQKDSKLCKGVKLDFKSTEVFQKSLSLIQSMYNKVTYPIWLNADIISGPQEATTIPVDPDIFLSQSKQFEKAVLSLGWTTKYDGPAQYTDSQINEMIKKINDTEIKQEITFAVRAGIAAQSPKQMQTLQDQVPNCTLTIWSSEGDSVDVENLRELIFAFGVDRVYVDVPEDLRDKLNLGSTGANAKPSTVLMLVTVIFAMALFRHLY